MHETTKDGKAHAVKGHHVANEESHIIHDVRDAAHRFKDDAHDAAAAIKADVENAARRTGRQAREMADSAGQNVTDAGEAILLKIRNKPVQSVAIALGVGLLAGIFCRRG